MAHFVPFPMCGFSGVSLLETIAGQVYIGSERQTSVASPTAEIPHHPLGFLLAPLPFVKSLGLLPPGTIPAGGNDCSGSP